MIKNLNWEMLPKNLVTFNEGMGLRTKNFITMRVHWKILFLEGLFLRRVDTPMYTVGGGGGAEFSEGEGGAKFSEGARILEDYHVFLQTCTFCGNNVINCSYHYVYTNIFDIAQSLTQNDYDPT